MNPDQSDTTGAILSGYFAIYAMLYGINGKVLV